MAQESIGANLKIGTKRANEVDNQLDCLLESLRSQSTCTMIARNVARKVRLCESQTSIVRIRLEQAA